MNRTTLGYFLMAISAGAILWGILRLGSRLQAPPDWSGEWETVADDVQHRHVTIQQSGVYVHLNMDGQIEPCKLENGYGWQLKGPHRSWSTQGVLGNGELVLTDYASSTHLTLRRTAKAADGSH